MGLDLSGEWAVDEFHGHPAIVGAAPSLTFGADGRLAGFTGVNRLATPFEIDGDRVTVGAIVTTRMEGMARAVEQEAGFLAALEATTHWRIDGEVLTLVGPGGSIRAHHVPLPLVVRGHVSYRERIAFPGNAVVTVEIRDLERADDAAQIVASQVIGDALGSPVEFEIPIDRSVLTPRRRVGVAARIEVDGELWWISDSPRELTSDGHASYDLVLERVPYVE